MEVVPYSVGVASRDWDEQRLDLQAAAGQVGAAGSGAFTSPVSGAASRFLTTWERHATTLGRDCEAQADGLRVAIRDYVASDEAVGVDLMLLLSFMSEER